MRFNIVIVTTGAFAFHAPLTTAFLTSTSDIVNGITSEISGVENMEGQMALINATNVGYAWNSISVDLGHWARALHFVFLSTSTHPPPIINTTHDASAVSDVFDHWTNEINSALHLVDDAHKFYKDIPTPALKDYANQTMYQSTLDLFGGTQEITQFLTRSLVNFPKVEKDIQDDYAEIIRSTNQALNRWDSPQLTSDEIAI